jgi:hypothetical protein
MIEYGDCKKMGNTRQGELPFGDVGQAAGLPHGRNAIIRRSGQV